MMGASSKNIDPVEQRFDAADKALRDGRTEAACDLLDALLREHPTHYRSLLLQGAVAMGRSQFSKCEMYTRAALRLLPDDGNIDLPKAVVMAQLADALAQQNKTEEAGKIRAALVRANLAEKTDGAGATIIPKALGVIETASSSSKSHVEDPAMQLEKGVQKIEPSTGHKNNLAKFESAVAASKPSIQNMAPSPLWTQDELMERKVVFVGMRQREILNAFREVRIKLLENAQDDNLVVLVSSLKVGGGASFFAYNLAATFALDPNKTALFVDCNPYDSSAERYVNGVVNKGLSHYLQDSGVTIEEILYPSGVERVRVIPAAGSNESAAELFYTKRMKSMIDEIKSRYPDRFIILDAPSVQSSTEARILAQYCDKALLLVPFGKATRDEVVAGVEAVGRKRFAGLVFNY